MTAKLTPKVLDVFALDAGASTLPFGDFDKTKSTKDPDILQSYIANIMAGGWLGSLQPRKTPALDHFNTLYFLTTRKLKELQQQGIPTYISKETYHIGGLVMKTGTYELYGSKINNNKQNALPNRVDDDKWKYIIDLAGTGGLPKNFIDNEIYYGGEFDATSEILFGASNSAVVPYYTYEDYSYRVTQSALLASGIYDPHGSYVDNGVETLNFRVKFEPEAFDTNSALFGQSDRSAEECLCYLTSSGEPTIFLSSNGTSWNIADSIGVGYFTSLNTTYVIELTKTATQYIFTLYEEDGTTVLAQQIITNSATLYRFNYLIGYGNHAAARFFKGKIYMDDISMVVNGVERIRKQDVDFIPNSVTWKGEVRSDDNSTDIISNNLIRRKLDDTVFDASNQILDSSGVFKNTYDYNDYSITMYNTTAGYLYLYNNDNIFNALGGKEEFSATLRANFSSLATQGYLWGSTSSVTERYHIEVTQSGQLGMWLSSNGTSWNLASGLLGSYVFAINNTYDFRFSKTATQYILEYSLDGGDTWIIDVTLDSTALLQTGGNTTIGGAAGGSTRNMVGKLYLDGLSLAIDGVDVIRPQDVAYNPETDLVNQYAFVGLNNSDDTILEFTKDKTGGSLVDITGAKRRLGDDKDIVFPLDSSAELAPFTRCDNLWKFELWSGLSSLIAANAYTLNNSILDYNYFQCLFSQTSDASTYNGDYIDVKNADINSKLCRLYNTEANYVVGNLSKNKEVYIQLSSTSGVQIKKMIGVK